MRRIAIAAGLAFTLLGLAARPAHAADWLHVFVEDDGGRETVRINLPFDLVEAVLPLIDEDDFHHGRVVIDDEDFDREQIEKILDALEKAEEGEYIHVDEVDEDVRVAKKGSFILIRSEGDGENVDVKVHLSFFRALLAGEENELDLLAAFRTLSEQKGETLVMVNDEESRVRIWIDDSCSSD
ncbi:MAG: hypothetical protein JW958_01860 [Candidatus Eisenbacteria bacterium]|nr:hypothetical protein [Candidatus Eisenbacteria bacterium]